MENLQQKGAGMPAEFYTTEELAEYVKLSEQTIRLWIKQGKVKSYKFGRAHRIPVDEVRRLLDEASRESQQEVTDGSV